MLRLRMLARTTLGLGLVLETYQFVLAALTYWADVSVPAVFHSAWELAVCAAPALIVFGGILLFGRWLLKAPAAKNASVGLAFIGVVLLVVAYSLHPALFYLCFANRTEGRIVAMHPTARGSLVPDIEYTVAGHTYKLEPHHERTKSSAPEYAVGDTLPVLYRPDVPTAAVVGTFTEVWGLAVFASVIATVLFVLLVASRPDRPRHQAAFYFNFVVIDRRSGAGQSESARS